MTSNTDSRGRRRIFITCGSSFPRTSPHRLTPSAVRAIEDRVTSPDDRHVPTGTLAVLAQRLGTAWAAPSTWDRLVRTYGGRRPRLRVHPEKPRWGSARLDRAARGPSGRDALRMSPSRVGGLGRGERERPDRRGDRHGCPVPSAGVDGAEGLELQDRRLVAFPDTSMVLPPLTRSRRDRPINDFPQQRCASECLGRSRCSSGGTRAL
jgi:hypothetical protein